MNQHLAAGIVFNAAWRATAAAVTILKNLSPLFQQRLMMIVIGNIYLFLQRRDILPDHSSATTNKAGPHFRFCQCSQPHQHSQPGQPGRPHPEPMKDLPLITPTAFAGMVAPLYHLPASRVLRAGRGTATEAMARQLLMYLLHVSCGHSYTAVGAMIGRDRTTVAHGCQLVEDRRENPALDWSLDVIEMAAGWLARFNERDGRP